jgi:hypothetical protein
VPAVSETAAPRTQEFRPVWVEWDVAAALWAVVRVICGAGSVDVLEQELATRRRATQTEEATGAACSPLRLAR